MFVGRPFMRLPTYLRDALVALVTALVLLLVNEASDARAGQEVGQVATTSDDIRTILNDLQSDDLNTITAALTSVETFEGDVSALVRELSAVIDADDYATIDMAFRALQRLKARASPAVPSLCRKLDDRRHWIRSSAVNALVSIGEASVPAAQRLLTAPSGAARAGATDVLGRLQRMTLDQCLPLMQDADPRVRAALARPLSQLHAPAIPLLVTLLSDPEIAVAHQATVALRVNHDDPPSAIRGLTAALSRMEIRDKAGGALSSYGITAQRAIPGVINSYPRDQSHRRYAFDRAQLALDHIGPPHEDDVPLLCECLTHPNYNAAGLAASRLGMLGTKAKASAPALVAACLRAAQEYRDQKQAATPESKRRFRVNEGFPILYLVQRSADALWRVTKDDRAFIKTLALSVSKSADMIRYFTHLQSSPWRELSPDVLPDVEAMLRHAEESVRLTALAGVIEWGAAAAPLKHLIRDLVDAGGAKQAGLARQALVSLGQTAVDVSGPKLLADLRGGKIKLNDLAISIGRARLGEPSLLKELEGCLLDLDQNDNLRATCAWALCSGTSEPHRIAPLIIDLAERSQLPHVAVIHALGQLKDIDNVLIPYLVERLSNQQAVNETLELLGQRGKNAASALPQIEQLLEAERPRFHFSAAKAILRITGNPTPLEKEFEKNLNSADAPINLRHVVDAFNSFGPDDTRNSYSYLHMDTIAQCQRAGAPLMHYIVDERHQLRPDGGVMAIDALRAIGTPEAVLALENAAQSTDWEIRSAAMQALKQLRVAPPMMK